MGRRLYIPPRRESWAGGARAPLGAWVGATTRGEVAPAWVAAALVVLVAPAAAVASVAVAARVSRTQVASARGLRI